MPADTTKKSEQATWMMIGAGVGAGVAAFLPWYSVGMFKLDGTAGDGQITLVLGGVLALLGFLRKTKRSSPVWVAIIVAGLIALIGGYHYASNSNEEFVSSGIGVYATVAAGIVGLLGALIARQYPTVPAVVAAAVVVAPGWYADPVGASALRYWDGVGWTEHTTTSLAAPGRSPLPNPASGNPETGSDAIETPADHRVPTSAKFAALKNWQKALIIVGVGLGGGALLVVLQSL